MIPKFEILIPNDLNEALNILAEKKDGVKIIAGGTDVVTGLQQGSKRFANSELLIDINRIPETKNIVHVGYKISIGSTETFSDILQSRLVEEHLPLLWKACSTIGSVQIRNRATIAGNFVNNAPCADTVPALLVYNATIEVESLSSKKEISIGEFLEGPYKTKLGKDEIVTRINIPIPSKELKGEFYKLGRRRAVAISRITLAVLMSKRNSLIEEIRIASGAVTPIGIRFHELEEFAKGKKVEDQFLKILSAKFGDNILRVTGLRWSSEYKLPVVQQMFYQLLKEIEHG